MNNFCDEKSRNKIKVIPDQISKLKKLSRLNLAKNNVEDISENISELRNLEYLNLSGNNYVLRFMGKNHIVYFQNILM